MTVVSVIIQQVGCPFPEVQFLIVYPSSGTAYALASIFGRHCTSGLWKGLISQRPLIRYHTGGYYTNWRERRLRWFGHVARSSGAIRTAYDMQIDGKRGAGRPKQTWKKLTEKDCCEWKLTTVDPQERSTWKSGVRSAMRAASQLPGKGPTDVDDAPAPAR